MFACAPRNPAHSPAEREGWGSGPPVATRQGRGMATNDAYYAVLRDKYLRDIAAEGMAAKAGRAAWRPPGPRPGGATPDQRTSRRGTDRSGPHVAVAGAGCADRGTGRVRGAARRGDHRAAARRRRPEPPGTRAAHHR